MATNATQEEWLRTAPGKSFDPDRAHGLQCVDVADAYAEAIHGVPWGQCFGGGNANQHFPKNNGYFTSIGYNGHNRPERGDIIVWDGNGYGHIAVVASSTSENVSVIQQNYNTPTPTKPASLDVVPYNFGGLRCVGWLRPNVPGATTPDPGEIVLGNGSAGSGGAAVVTRQKDQRWADESCDVLESPRPGARKTGSIGKGDLVTMGGYVLGEWVSWNGRGSSFWFKPTAKGGATRGGESGSGTVLDGMDWDKLCMLEASGNWSCNTGNGFYGGLQFTYTTWLEFGGGKYADRADHATREQQIEIGRAVLKGQGVKAWPNTGPKCYNPGAADSGGDTGTAGGSSESLDGYVPFVYFSPQETYGVPDRTPYDTWTTNVPNPPKLAADAPEAHWDGNTWVGWQWNDSRTQVVWVTPNGITYDGAWAASSSSTSSSAMYPEPIPTHGPIHEGEISDAMWNYLLYIGWGGIPYDGEGEALWPPGTPGIVHAFQMPTGPVDWGDVSEEVWKALMVYGWYGIPGDGHERLYPPERPMIVSPAFGSVSATSGYSNGAYGPKASSIAQYSRTGMDGTWHYIAQRATTGEFLDMDLPLSRDELTWELSGPGVLRATISPDYGLLRADDDELLLQEWGTLIYAEADGEIRWGGILINSGWEGDTWQIECAGFAAYPSGMPYGGEFMQTGVDPGEMIRHIWEHLQNYQYGNLNVRVTDSVTGALIGLPKGPVTPTQVPLVVYDYLRRANWTPRDGDTNPARIYPPGYDGDVPPRENSDPLDPYELLWWEAPDCGTAIDNIVRDTPLDYVERHAWADDGTIKHEIQVAYPRIGRRRNDLAFIQGDNVTSVVAPSTDGDYYANEVMGIGAGEGAGSIRRSTAQVDGRLRRVSVFSGKDTTSAAQLDNAIATELRKRQASLVIDSIEVRNHPNAPIGSWALGDDILVRADIPWLGEVELWCRIVGWTLTSDDTATLQLQRSDMFAYAAGTIEAESGPISYNHEPVPYPGSDVYPSKSLYPNDPSVAGSTS